MAMFHPFPYEYYESFQRTVLLLIYVLFKHERSLPALTRRFPLETLYGYYNKLGLQLLYEWRASDTGQAADICTGL